jgi:hypothetical protein
MEIIMPGHHLRKTNFRYRMAAGLLHRSDLESSCSFCSFFPDLYRSKTQEDSKTRFVLNKNMSLLLNRNLHTSDWLPSVVRRCGGHGGGNCGADSGVRCALCVLPSSDVQACPVLYWVFRVWAGSIQRHPKFQLGCQEEEEGSKRRRRIGVRGGPVEGQREEGQKTTLTWQKLIMSLLIPQVCNDPTASWSLFLACVILVFVQKF